jgi:hypothetical protein
MKRIKFSLNMGKKWEVVGSLLLIAVFVLPFLTFASGSKKIFVDSSASGSQTGSASHPYRKIGDALDHAKDGNHVIVLKGTYKENITIPHGVKVFGSDTDDVTITAKDDDKSVVTMKDETEIDKITIKDGDKGVRIEDDAKASIVDCVIRNNDQEGVLIEGSNTDDGRRVTITRSTIRKNGRSGIFSGERRLILINNEINENNRDGINLQEGVHAWIDNNTIRDNGGNGIVVQLDKADIWTKFNAINDNDNGGIEIDARGTTGRFDSNGNKIRNNGGFAISRINRSSVPLSVWNGVTIQGNTEIKNNKGGITRIMNIF